MYTVHLVSYRYCYSINFTFTLCETFSEGANKSIGPKSGAESSSQRTKISFLVSCLSNHHFPVSFVIFGSPYATIINACLQSYKYTHPTTAAPFAACWARRRLSTLYFQPMKLIGQAYLSRVRGKYKLCAMCTHSCMHDKLMPRRGLFVTVDTSILWRSQMHVDCCLDWRLKQPWASLLHWVCFDRWHGGC